MAQQQQQGGPLLGLHPPKGGVSMQQQKTAWLASTERRMAVDWKQSTHEGRREMLNRYKFIMKEIDIACGNLFRSREPNFQFMDVCCSPGGFSEYVLESNACRGVGLSLPEELGGHTVAIDPRVASPDRYHMYMYDVTTIAKDLRCESLYQDPQKPPSQCLVNIQGRAAPPGCSNNMDMMILDGSFLGGKGFYSRTVYERDEDNPAFNVYCSSFAADQALLVAQIIIMCNNLKAGGSVVLRLSMTWNDFRNGVLCLLRRIFDGAITNYKPRSCHTDKISYYLMCSGFVPRNAQKLGIVPAMQVLLDSLRSGGRDAMLVPFPMLDEGRSREALIAFWRPSLLLYYHNLQAFLNLVRMVQQYQNVAKQSNQKGQQGQRAYIWSPCWRLMAHSKCNDPNCLHAHKNDDLHPFVQEAFALTNGRMEWPAVAAPMFHQLLTQGEPKFRAVQRLRAKQRQVMEQQQQEMLAMQQEHQMRAMQQHMAMAGGADMAGGLGASLLAGVDDARLSNMITHEMLQMIRSHMTYGDPFMAMQQYFSQDDSVFSDMQQASMQAMVAAQNARAMQAMQGQQSMGQQRTQQQQQSLLQPPAGPEPAPASNAGSGFTGFLSGPGLAPKKRKQLEQAGQQQQGQQGEVANKVAALAGGKRALWDGDQQQQQQPGMELAGDGGVGQKPAVMLPLQAPQVSGYLQWLSMIKLVVADDGYTLQALLEFLGE